MLAERSGVEDSEDSLSASALVTCVDTTETASSSWLSDPAGGLFEEGLVLTAQDLDLPLHEEDLVVLRGELGLQAARVGLRVPQLLVLPLHTPFQDGPSGLRVTGLLQRLLQLDGQLLRTLLEHGQFRLAGLLLFPYPQEFLFEVGQLDRRRPTRLVGPPAQARQLLPHAGGQGQATFREECVQRRDEVVGGDPLAAQVPREGGRGDMRADRDLLLRPAPSGEAVDRGT